VVDCYLNPNSFPRFGSVQEINMESVKICGPVQLPSGLKKCQIHISEVDSYIAPSSDEYPPMIVISPYSEELESLKVCYASDFKQCGNKPFRVQLPLELSSLKNLILRMNDRGILILNISNLECFSKLDKYYGDDPSKIIVNYYNELTRLIETFDLKSILPSNAVIDLQNEPDPIEEEIS